MHHLLRSALLLIGLSSNAIAAPQPVLWELWAASNEQNHTEVEHGAWNTLLATYLVTTADGSTAVRYEALNASGKTQLDDYVQHLTALDSRTLRRTEQMAYWINLYNALTVQVVLNNPGKKSILRMGKGWLPRGPWDDKVCRIAGQDLTLNDIEHRILRPSWQDHRIHFALNCASVGCPNLAPQAYRGKDLPALLDQAEATYLRHPRGLQFDGQRLVISSIFDWYMDDFASDRTGLLRYLASVRPDLADRLTGYQGNLSYQYDWALNAANR